MNDKKHKCSNPLCEKYTTNPKFCSMTCAAIFNNKIHKKRKRKTYRCKICDIEIQRRKTLCDIHNPQVINWNQITLRTILTDIEKHGPSNRYSRIRAQAKIIYKRSTRPKCCERCGYKFHYEICHIKAIHLFDLDTSITVINDLSNLIALCPNCHWEMDNGLFIPTTQSIINL